MNNPTQTAIRINKQLAAEFMFYAKNNNRTMTQQLEFEIKRLLGKSTAVTY